MSYGPKILYEWRFAGYLVRIEETEPGIVRFVQAQCEHGEPSVMSFQPTEKPLGTANEIIHLSSYIEILREQVKQCHRQIALRAWWDCLDCGSHVSVDEDGCCSTCGRDAEIIDLDYAARRMATLEREVEKHRDLVDAVKELLASEGSSGTFDAFVLRSAIERCKEILGDE